MDKLYIIIPAYNEESNIEEVARQWHDVVKNINDESRLVIIDDGSKDSTLNVLESLKEELSQLEVVTKENSGHGATVLYGYNYALENGAEYIFQTDSDGQTLPEEFYPFWEERDNYAAITATATTEKMDFHESLSQKLLNLCFGAFSDSRLPMQILLSGL